MKHTAFYASVGRFLTHYDIDVDELALVKRETLELPGNIQYVWPHASKPYMYAAVSSAVSHEVMGTQHALCALAIDANCGAVSIHGRPVPLRNRAIHLTLDHVSEHVLVAFSRPSDLHIYRINGDASIGEQVPQGSGLDLGVLPHQVRVTADGQLAILATRGNPFNRGQHDQVQAQSDPGALKVFEYKNGVLGEEISVAPDGGRRFGVRGLDFHPTGPSVFVSLQIQNRMLVFKREGTRILPEPLFQRELLPDPQNPPCIYQRGGEVHVHPNGKFVYCVNRADVPVDHQGRKVLVGADNSFVVFALNETTGEPALIQRIDTMGVEPRTFSVHPDGRMLVAANGETHLVKVGDEIREVCANLAVFEVKSDGTLGFVRKYDMPVPLTNYSPASGNFGNDELYWAGFVDY